MTSTTSNGSNARLEFAQQTPRVTGASGGTSGYSRYHINTENTPDIEKWPARFTVKVGKRGLAKLMVKEVFHYGFNKEVLLSRPCMYGVFSGPVGGFAPQPEHCVGCLRCTTEYPDFVQVAHNPERRKLGDGFFTFSYVDSVTYEAETGLVPVRGAGYRGKFGGQGWDGMWTDMSEIVRPTRDGIHGREFISTVVDIGYRPNMLVFDDRGQPVGPRPHTIQVQAPILFDTPPANLKSKTLWRIMAKAAAEVETLAFLPLGAVLQCDLEDDHVVPIIRPSEEDALNVFGAPPRMIEMGRWDEQLFEKITQVFPEALVSLRTPFVSSKKLLKYYNRGVRVFHLLADYHGRGEKGLFILDLIRKAHLAFVEAGVRQEVTLLGSGGMIAAEHVPKAILCGLDAVAIDTAALVALQAKFDGQCANRETSKFRLPRRLNEAWGVQRLKNLTASWRDQLLEILGAMGLREVRRMRGEMGRAMFMTDLEQEAFAGVDGYERT